LRPDVKQQFLGGEKDVGTGLRLVVNPTREMGGDLGKVCLGKCPSKP